MMRVASWRVAAFAVGAWMVAVVSGSPVLADAAPRLALVIGESAYAVGPLPTTANDAGAVAQSLALAGFDVTARADLDLAGTKRVFGDFIAKAKAAGPGASVVVYLAGYGVQFDGDNFLVPTEARLARDTDVPTEAVPLADLGRAVAGLPLAARIIIEDLARPNLFARTGGRLANGLALAEPSPGTLVASNTAPGAVADLDHGTYGLYAQALCEMMQVKGLSIQDVLSRVRARVNALTNGAAVPWNDGTLETPFAFFPPASATSAAGATPNTIADAAPEDAYWLAIMGDTLQGYVAFLKAYPDDPLASRVATLLAARREALTWARSVGVNTAVAYWTYMRRYPRGPHFGDARRLLAALPAALEPPPRFDVFVYPDLPPPFPEERAILDRPHLTLDDGAFAVVQSPASVIVPERHVAFYERSPPLLAVAEGALPLPMPIPLGFKAEQGRIAQPDVGMPGETIVATDGADKSGGPVVTQTAQNAAIVSVATMAVGPDGKRVITQTGPDKAIASTITETRNADGGHTVVQTGPDARVIATTTTTVAANGNRVTTLIGADNKPIDVARTTPNGVILGATRTPIAAPAAPRPTVLRSIAAPTVAAASSGAPPVPVHAVPSPAAKPLEPSPALQPSPAPEPGSRLAAGPTVTPQPLVVPDAPMLTRPPRDVVAPLPPTLRPIAPTIVSEPKMPIVAPPAPLLGPAVPAPAVTPMIMPVLRQSATPSILTRPIDMAPPPAKAEPPPSPGKAEPPPPGKAETPAISSSGQTMPIPPRRPNVQVPPRRVADAKRAETKKADAKKAGAGRRGLKPGRHKP